MKVIKSLTEMMEFSQEISNKGKSIGFVPTMGYLHEGHLSLIRKAKEENDVVVVSIFVNPTQFGPNEDFNKYPRDEKGDTEKIEREGVSVVFIPDASEIYPEGFQTYVEVEEFTKNLCGIFRPTHFRGVTTIVLKLFNIISPQRAYFGKKDYQQFRVIEQMCKDLNLNIKIIPCPIVREEDGLAMSSRNKYLTEEERIDATILHKALTMGKEIILSQERDAETIIKKIKEMITSKKTLNKIDYVSIVNPYTLANVSHIESEVLIAVAAYFGKTRLIDNIEVEINANNVA